MPTTSIRHSTRRLASCCTVATARKRRPNAHVTAAMSFAAREALRRKEEGNAAYAAGKFRAAIEAYTEAIVSPF